VERGVQLMRRLFPYLLLLFATPAEARDLVLVVRADSPVTTLDSLAVRKLYFGFVVTAGERELLAMRLAGDQAMEQAFLQNVVGMSEAQYESRLLRLTLKQGRPAPKKLTSAEEIIGILSRNPSAVGCLWADQVAGRDNLRVVKLLWRE
jgi:hypothetical protein